MGRDVPAITVTMEDRRRYREKVRRCLDVFAAMLRDSRFDSDPPTIGLEIELNLVDADGEPAMCNAAVLEAIDDPAWATELGLFNIELNIPPSLVTGDALDDLEQHIRDDLNRAEQRGRQVGGRLISVGILPTLRESQVGEGALSSNSRYRLLNDQIFASRGEDLHLAIDGAEELRAYASSITPEAACTSVQLHLQVSPDDFAGYWNAAQAVAGVQVALAANSPYLFGRELWQESRIPLFEQATDTRPEELKEQGVRPRVWFGERWITSVFDLFEENARYFPSLLPLCDEEDPVEELKNGRIPTLGELALHNGTVYRWNRPVYAVANGRPHLRVENRVLPAGPTVADTMANSAFYYGLVNRLAIDERPIWSRMSFATAEDNLHSGARFGMDARIYWPGLGDVPVAELVLRKLLPLAAEGLDRWGVHATARDRLLGIIEQRCLTGRNGARWQTETVRRLQEQGHDRHEALRLMVQRYIEHMHTNVPVHDWPVQVY
jgi:gamma-glutamyl:cysteine ligase YbdK (ATP-grasp superfamily)